ncbi:MAG: hypothetical protein R3Y07_02715 [Eubacteriales bacterium]
MFPSKRIKQLEEENASLQAEMFRLSRELRFVKSENINLLKKLENTPTKKNNERGAGRVSKIQNDTLVTICTLLNNGKKVSEIVAILNSEQNRKCSKSTVYEIKNQRLTQDSHGTWKIATKQTTDQETSDK